VSTVDPDDVSREQGPREWKTTGVSGHAVVGLVVYGLILLSTAGGIAWGLTRGSFTGFVEYGPEKDEVAIIVTIVSSFPFLAAFGGWVWVAARNPRLPGWATATGIALFGAAAGHAMTAPRPEIIQAPFFDAVSVGLGVGGVVLLALGAVSRTARVRQLDFQDELMRTSSPVAGTVSNPGNMNFDSSDGSASWIGTSATYTFHDASGVQRWVTQGVTVHRSRPLVKGENVDVWFDRQDPSNTSRIVIRRRAIEEQDAR
jgi:hypothetical protein